MNKEIYNASKKDNTATQYSNALQEENAQTNISRVWLELIKCRIGREDCITFIVNLLYANKNF